MSEQPPQATAHDNPQPVARRWLAPAVALALAVTFLLILLIPGVLRYRGGIDEVGLQALRDSNAALEGEITRLAQADEAGVCMYEGALFPRSVEEASGPPEPGQRLDLLPPQPAQITPAPDALPDEAAFEGSLDDLLRRSTVMVLATQPEGFGNGTGFFVDPRHVVTNAHVVEGVEEVIVTNDLIRKPLNARVIARTAPEPGGGMPQADFSLLELAQPVETALPLRLGPARRTQTVYASGYPGFYLEDQILAYYSAISQGHEAAPPEAVVTDGMVTTIQSVQRAGGVLDYIPHTARISPGNSGGPLVDACGRVVGINTFITQSSGAGELLLHGDYALATGGLAAFLRQHGAEAGIAADPCMSAAPTPSPSAPVGASEGNASPDAGK